MPAADSEQTPGQSQRHDNDLTSEHMPQTPPAGGATEQHGTAAYESARLDAFATVDQGSRGKPAAELPHVEGYEILEVLGRGGMGVVYKAVQVKLKRLVAIKMVLTGAHASPHELERFQAEAQAVAHLHHPNIVQVYEVGEAGGYPFFSLEYVDGGSLADKLKGTPQPADDSARLVQEVAWAVQYAHEHGIIHRDLKPANVLLAISGQQSAVSGRGLVIDRRS